MIGRSLFCWEDDTYWRVVRVLDNGDLRAERVTPDGVRFLITEPDNPDIEIGRCMLRVGDVVSVRSCGHVRRLRLDYVGPTHVAGDEVTDGGYRGRWCGTRGMLERLWVDESDRTA